MAQRCSGPLLPPPSQPLLLPLPCDPPAGDFSFPGIGLPAVAASGAVTANSLVSVAQHEALLTELGL